MYEHQGKQLLKEAGIAIPKGDVAFTKEQAGAIADKIGKPVALKAQILAGGRGKAGAIRFADTAQEAEKIAEETDRLLKRKPRSAGPASGREKP